MALMETLKADMRTAMKARDKARLSTIRMLIAEVQNAQLEKPGGLSDDDELTLLARQAKRRRESIAAFEGAGREELAAAEAAELEVIEAYLPKPLSAEDVSAIVAEVVASTGAAGMQDMGRVMGAVMPKVKGRFPGKDVRPLVEAALRG